MSHTPFIYRWLWIHKWSSLACTAFMLLCLTGLPLIFHEEIEHLSGVVEALPMANGVPRPTHHNRPPVPI